MPWADGLHVQPGAAGLDLRGRHPAEHGQDRAVDLGANGTTKAFAVMDDDPNGHAEWHPIKQSRAGGHSRESSSEVDWNEIIQHGRGQYHHGHLRATPSRGVTSSGVMAENAAMQEHAPGDRGGTAGAGVAALLEMALVLGRGLGLHHRGLGGELGVIILAPDAPGSVAPPGTPADAGTGTLCASRRTFMTTWARGRRRFNW